MTWFLRTLRLLALVVWVGGLIFFVAAVTIVAFRQLPSAHEAGIVVRGCLLALHRIGLVAGTVYILATLLLITTLRDADRLRLVEVLIVLGMLVVTAYSQFSVVPRMESARLAAGGDIANAAPNSRDAAEFNRLHPLSEKLEGAVLLGGVALVLLASVHQPPRFLE